ncbi:hypothetical protein QF050_002950 [Arthrobacter sp. SLBN-112]|nr:hypothetical protein [Arthrobacter sp. SLBN-112]
MNADPDLNFDYSPWTFQGAASADGGLLAVGDSLDPIHGPVGKPGTVS